MWSETQLAYLAGFFDGEGTVYLYKRMKPEGWPNHDIRFQITNTNKEVIEWIHKIFGGQTYYKDRSLQNAKWKPSYLWHANRKVFDQVAPAIFPFIIVKRAQLELAFEFRKTYSSKNRHHSDMKILHSLRDEMVHKMRALNKKGSNTSALSSFC